MMRHRMGEERSKEGAKFVLRQALGLCETRRAAKAAWEAWARLREAYSCPSSSASTCPSPDWQPCRW